LELSSKSIYTTGVRTETQKFCRHYERNSLPNNTPITPNSGNPAIGKVVSVQTAGGMSGGSFFGLIFGLFITGIILGTVGYFGYQYYKREVKDTGRPGLNVRFVKDGDKASVHS